MADRLYVIFHGLVGLFEDTTMGKFRAILPEMNLHRVALGHWLTEKTVPRGALLELTTPTPAQTPTSLDPNKHLVVKRPAGWKLENQSAWAEFGYAEIRLPMPDDIHYFHTLTIGANTLFGSGVPPGKQWAASRVFEYHVAPNQCTIGPIGDPTPATAFEFTPSKGVTVGADSVNTIHILNEPETDTDDFHAREEFRRLAEIWGVDVQLNSVPKFPANTTLLPPGLVAEELWPLTPYRAEYLAANVESDRTGKTVSKGFGAIGGHSVCGGADGGGN